MKYFLSIFLILNLMVFAEGEEGLPLFFWQAHDFMNFGDHLSIKLVERIVGNKVKKYREGDEKKLLAIGSILIFAKDNDVIWGTGMNGKRMDLKDYQFANLDVRSVRGPKTRNFIMKNFQIECPEIYGDPALLIPYFFPEFHKKKDPKYEYIIIPHYSDAHLFPKEIYLNVVYPSDAWDQVIRKIVDSKFVISSSLHGIIVAEAFGIPARYVRLSDAEPLFKYQDYYLGTGRPHFQYATSIQEALNLGGEEPYDCDLKQLYESFPFEYWPNSKFKHPQF